MRNLLSKWVGSSKSPEVVALRVQLARNWSEGATHVLTRHFITWPRYPPMSIPSHIGTKQYTIGERARLALCVTCNDLFNAPNEISTLPSF